VLYILNYYDLIFDPWNACVCVCVCARARVRAYVCASMFLLSNVSWVINIKLQVIITLMQLMNSTSVS